LGLNDFAELGFLHSFTEATENSEKSKEVHEHSYGMAQSTRKGHLESQVRKVYFVEVSIRTDFLKIFSVTPCLRGEPKVFRNKNLREKTRIHGLVRWKGAAD
jgi:hypothetical protein